MFYFKKIISFFILIFKLILGIFSAMAYTRILEYLGGLVIWSVKGFKTSLKEEINADYQDGEPYYKKFLTPYFIGFLVYLILFFIVGIIITT